jgi:hypothetical protein
MPFSTDIILSATIGALVGHYIYLFIENRDLNDILYNYNRITSKEMWFSSYFLRENVSDIKFKNGIVYTIENMREFIQSDKKFVSFDDKKLSEEEIVKMMMEVSNDFQISSVTFNTGTTIEVSTDFHNITPLPPTSETLQPLV